MTKADRRATVFGIFLIAAGVATCITLCSHIARGQLFIAEEMMGYSNGVEAYNGSCKNKPSLLACVNCCIALTAGMPSNEQGVCIDLCLDQWEGAGDNVAAIIVDAGIVVETGNYKDYVGINQAKNLLRVAQHSKRERIARLARGLCKQFNLNGTVQS